MTEDQIQEANEETAKMYQKIGQEKMLEITKIALHKALDYFVENEKEEGCLWRNLASEQFMKKVAEFTAPLLLEEYEKLA